jgi:hypothetical protein
MLNLESLEDPLCTTVISTEYAMGLSEMKVTTKFTSLEICNATKLVSGFLKHNAPPVQKDVVAYLTTVYESALTMSAEGMNNIHSFSDLMYYRRLFYYYTSKITFMLDQWGEMFHTMNQREKHVKFQEQMKRIGKMEMNRLLACGIPIGIIGCFLIYPVSLVAELTVCCWAPCYVGCKIASIDSDIEQDRIRRIKERENYW